MNFRSFLVLTICLFFLAFAMGLYVWQLRSRAQLDSTTPALQAVTPPVTGSLRQVTLWVAHDDPGVLRVQGASVELSAERQRKAAEILLALIHLYASKDSPHRLHGRAEVRNVYFVDPGLVVIDMNSDFAEGQTSGILPEELTVISFVQTLATNMPEVSRVKFLVNGKEAETLAGHFDLSAEYGVSQISELAKQLSQ